MRIKVLGSESSYWNITTNGSNFGSATVRLVNSGGTDRLVSIENNPNSLIGTFTLKANSSEVVEKEPSDEIFCQRRSIRCWCCNNRIEL